MWAVLAGRLCGARRKVKGETRFGECVGFWKGKDFCPNDETFKTSKKRKLIMLSRRMRSSDKII